jgi:hypothetical protein
VHAAGSSHCGEIKSKSTFSRDTARLSPLALSGAVSFKLAVVRRTTRQLNATRFTMHHM